ncbi:reverse transcriptase domain-containing protein [Tanacetum coccineum]
MHTHASNSKLVEPLREPERTLNRRLRRRNRRVPYDQRNNPPQNLRIIYPPVLNINYFRHFLDILQNYDPMDDEPMWAADHVVAPTPGFAITIPETVNEFAIKDTKNEVVRLMMFPLSLIGEAKIWLDELNEGTIETWDELRTAFIIHLFPPTLFDRLLGEIQAFSQHENESLTDAWLLLLKLDWPKNQNTKSSLKKTVAFTDKGSSNSDTDKIMARMDAMTLKMDAQYKELQSNAKKTKPNLDEDDIPISGKSYKPPVNPNDQQNNSETPINFDSDDLEDEPTPQPKTQNPKLVKETPLPKPYKPKIPLSLETLKPTKMSVRLADRSFQYLVGIAENMLVEDGKFTFPANFVILKMEEDKESFNSLLEEGNKILHSIKGTLLEEEIFVKFDEFMAMTADENSDSESNTKEPPFEKITINTDYKIKTSLKEPPTDLELKPLLDNLESVFLEEPSFLPVII